MPPKQKPPAEGEKRSLMPKSWDGVMDAAVKFGPATVMLAGVLYWALAVQTKRADALNDKFEQHMTTTAALVTHLQQESQQSFMLVAIAQRICLNTAKSDMDRMNCVVSERAGGGK